MATLYGQLIKDTYEGLLKFTDNDIVSGTKKRITDGLGNDTSILISDDAFEVDSFMYVNKNAVASLSKLGLNISSPLAMLHVQIDSVSSTIDSNAIAVFEKSGDASVQFLSGNAGTFNLMFGDDDSANRGRIAYSHANNEFKFYTDNATVMTLTSTRYVGINEQTPTQRLHVDGNLRVTGAYYDSNNTAGTSGQILSSTGTGTDWVSISEISGVDGTGSANYVAKWLDTDTITNSQIYDNGTNVGIGNALPSQKLTVSGNAYVTGAYYDSNNSPGTSGQILSSTATGTDWIDAPGGTVDGSGTANYFPLWSDADTLTDSVVYQSGSDIYIPQNIVHIGDTDSYFGFAAADFVQFRLAGASEFAVYSGGTRVYNTLRLDGAVQDSLASTGTSGQVLSSTGSATQWIDATGGIDGSGTANYVTKWIDADTIGNSIIYDNGTNVGIGTTSPARKLEVSFASSVYGARFTRNDAAGSSLIEFANNAGVKSIVGYDAGVDGFKIGTSTATNLTVKQSGNVGIGTTSPAKKLDVAGDWILDGITGGHFENYTFGSQLDVSEITSGGWARANRIVTSDSDGYVFSGVLGNSTTLTRAYWTIGNPSSISDTGYNSSNGIILLKNGNVGIGTTSPTQPLEVNGNIQATGSRTISAQYDSNHYMRLESNSSGGVLRGLDGGVTTVFVRSYGDSYFNGGNVGIGTTSPDEKLHITDSNGANIILNSNTANNNSGIYMSEGPDATPTQNGAYAYYDTANNAFKIATGTTSLIDRLTIARDSGALKLNQYGSGTFTGTATQRLGVDSSGNVIEIPIGSGAIDGSGTANYVTKWIDADTIGNSIIYDNGTNVGVGTSSPLGKLHVENSSVRSSVNGGADNIVIEENGYSGITILSNSANAGQIHFGDQDAENIGMIQYFHSDNSMRFATGNATEKMRITSSGNVGIGTTSPSTKLDVAGNTVINGTYRGGTLQVNDYNSNIDGVRVYGYSNNEILSLISRYDQADGGLFFKRGANGSETTIGEINWVSNQLRLNATVGNLAIQTSNSTAITIDGSQNVGIGTTSPSSPLTFGKSVYGNFDSENFYRIKLQDQGGTHNDVGIGQTASGNMGFNITAGGAFIFNNGTSGEIARFNGTGLGIGTTSPSAKLHIEGDGSIIRLQNNNSDTNGTFIDFRDSTGTRTGYVGTTGTSDDMFLFTQGAKPIRFYTNASERMVINSNGALQLNNYGSGTFTGTATQRLGVDSSGNIIEIAIGSGAVDGSGTANYVTKWTDADTIGNSIIYDDGTDIGISTSAPTHKLHVNGDARVGTNLAVGNTFGNKGTNQGINFESPSTALQTARVDADAFRFYFGGSGGAGEVFRILEGGNVGIGTTSPVAALNIGNNGNIRIDGNGSGNGIFASSNGSNNTFSFTRQDGVNVGDLSISGYSGVGITGGRSTSPATSAYSLYVQANGNVGIGTTSPSAKLQVGDGTFDANARVLHSDSTYTEMRGYGIVTNRTNNYYRPTADKTQILSIGNDGNTWNYITHNANYHTFGTDLNEWMRITNTGNVGIGTTSPGNKLSIVTGAGQDDTIPSLGSNGGKFSLLNNGGLYGLLAGVLGNGNSFLQTQRVDSTATAYNMLLNPNGGNVGIGTTSPSQKLHVNGNARVTGAYYDSGNSAGTSGQVLSSTGTGTDWIDAKTQEVVSAKIAYKSPGAQTNYLTWVAGAYQSSLDSLTYKIAVEDGSLDKIKVMSTVSVTGVSLELYKTSSPTSPIWSSGSFNLTANTVYSISPSGASFSENDVLYLSISTPASATIVYNFELKFLY